MTEGEMRNSMVINMYEPELLLVFFLLPFILVFIRAVKAGMPHFPHI